MTCISVFPLGISFVAPASGFSDPIRSDPTRYVSYVSGCIYISDIGVLTRIGSDSLMVRDAFAFPSRGDLFGPSWVSTNKLYRFFCCFPIACAFPCPTVGGVRHFFHTPTVVRVVRYLGLTTTPSMRSPSASFVSRTRSR